MSKRARRAAEAEQAEAAAAEAEIRIGQDAAAAEAAAAEAEIRISQDAAAAEAAAAEAEIRISRVHNEAAAAEAAVYNSIRVCRVHNGFVALTGGFEFDFAHGDSIALVFGISAKLLSSSYVEVKGHVVLPRSLRVGRILEIPMYNAACGNYIRQHFTVHGPLHRLPCRSDSERA
jgi:hypothetical protein